MSNVKKVLLAALATVCVLAVLVGGTVCSQRTDTSLCSCVHVVVVDSMHREYVDADALVSYLQSKGAYALGKAMNEIDCHKMEEVLMQHDMVRTANCYKTPFGAVQVRVTQRVPVMCVKSNDGQYLVDTDRRIMPWRSGLEQNLLVLSGAVSQRAAVEEYYDFMLWLKHNAYWGKRINGMHVHSTKHVVLSQAEYSARIVLGELDGYEAKLDRLRSLYAKGFDQIGYPECKELDLRFAGQVVRR